MPKAIKKKISKKRGLKEEEVKWAAIRYFDFLKDKKKLLVPAILLLSAAVVIIIVFFINSSSLKGKAHLFEKDAFNYYYKLNLKVSMTDEERWKKSLELFQKAFEIKSTPNAQFYIGNSYFNLGDYKNAITAYNQFIDQFKNDKIILPLVYQKLSSAYFRNGNPEEAYKTINTLAQFENGIFMDTALILEARLDEASKKPEEALKKYKELVADFPSSPWTDEANSKIQIYEKKEELGEKVSEEAVTEDMSVETGSESKE